MSRENDHDKHDNDACKINTDGATAAPLHHISAGPLRMKYTARRV
jgi:hypothetical protein